MESADFPSPETARARQMVAGPRPLFPASYLHDNCITRSIEAVPGGNARSCPCGGLFVRPRVRQGPANF